MYCKTCGKQLLAIEERTSECLSCRAGIPRGERLAFPKDAPPRPKREFNLSREIKPNHLILAVGAVVMLSIGAAYWAITKRLVASEYADALSLCETSLSAGSAKIEALDRIYGEVAKPAGLGLSLSLCNLKSATADYQRANSILRSLGN